MTDDPGWGGLIGDEDGATPAEPSASQPPSEQPGGLLPPDSTPGSLLPPDLKKIEPPSPLQNRRLTLILVVIAISLGVVGGGAAGVIVALSGHHKTTTTTTASTTTTTAGGGGTTTSTAAGNTGNEPALLTVIPSALSGHCEQTPTSDFVTSSVTDEVACATEDVSGSSADIIGYARFANSSAVDAYFNSMLSLNKMSSGSGSCSNLQLSESSSNGTYCAGSYTDSDSNTGNEVLFEGTSFNVGGASGSSQTFCETDFPGSTGVSVVAWTSPADDSFGFALDCTDSSAEFVDGMQSDLVHAAYVLND
jgi:hypothetical protein